MASLDARLPVNANYFTDLFPGLVISGLGLAVVFVPMNIGALTGVRPADAGVASGLINMTVQIGGAIGVAATVTIATTATADYASAHPGINGVAAALTHGYDLAFWVLAGVAAAGAVLTALMLESTPAVTADPAVARAALHPGSAA